MSELYKREICINCANENCKNRIETTRKADLCIEQISTVTTIFNYKECMKRKCKDCRKKKECFKEQEQ